MANLAALQAIFEERWPISGAESWDAPGLVCGSAEQEISRVLLTVDVTSQVLDEAIAGGFQLILAHHPFIMRGVNTLDESTGKGALLSKAIRAGVAIYAAHTNADVVLNGVSHTIALRLGLENITALDYPGETVGHGRLGLLPEPISLGEFARNLARLLPSTATGVRVAGDYNAMVEKVALCGGAGDSFIGAAIAAKAHVYVTSDLRHHVVQDAREQALVGSGAPALIDVSHWASEWLWLETAAAELRNIVPNLVFEVSDLRTDPWDFVITQ